MNRQQLQDYLQITTDLIDKELDNILQPAIIGGDIRSTHVELDIVFKNWGLLLDRLKQKGFILDRESSLNKLKFNKPQVKLWDIFDTYSLPFNDLVLGLDQYGRPVLHPYNENLLVIGSENTGKTSMLNTIVASAIKNTANPNFVYFRSKDKPRAFHHFKHGVTDWLYEVHDIDKAISYAAYPPEGESWFLILEDVNDSNLVDLISDYNHEHVTWIVSTNNPAKKLLDIFETKLIGKGNYDWFAGKDAYTHGLPDHTFYYSYARHLEYFEHAHVDWVEFLMLTENDEEILLLTNGR